MPKPHPRQALLVLAGASFLILLALAFLFLQLSLPFDDARLAPGSLALSDEGLRIIPLKPQPGGLQSGDLVVAIDGRTVNDWAEDALRLSPQRPGWEFGQVIPYTVQRGEQVIEVPVEMRAYPLGEVFKSNWGTLTFGPLYLLIGTFVFLRRPELPAARVLFLSSAAMFTATTWSLGLQANSFVFASSAWLYFFTTTFSYLLVFISSLLFAVVFPRQITKLVGRNWFLPLVYLLPYLYMGLSWLVARGQSSSLLGSLGLWSLRIDWPVSIYLALGIIVWILQYRRNPTDEGRIQLRWPLFAILVVGIVDLAVYFVPPLLGYAAVDSNWIGLFGILLPVSLAVAILRHKLFDIDVILNRTLLYVMLSAFIALIYVLSVGALSLGVQSSSSLAAALVTAVLLLIVYRPLQTQLQHTANRLVPVSDPVPGKRPVFIEVGKASAPRQGAVQADLVASEPRRPVLFNVARLAWYPAAVLALGIFALSAPTYLSLVVQGPHSEKFVFDPSPLYIALNLLYVIVALIVPLLSFLLSWVLFRRKADEPMALFLSFFLLVHGAISSGPLEGLEYLLPGVARFSVYVLQPSLTLPLSFLLFAIFPDGRFVPSWTRWMVIAAFISGPLTFAPFSESGMQMNSTLLVGAMAWLIITISLLYAQIYRYRYVSSVEERQQAKWFVFGIAAWFALSAISGIPWMYMETAPEGTLMPWWVPLVTLIWVLSTAVLPVSLTVAVMRFRLYDIDLIINRTLVYGALTATIIGLYVVVVGGLGSLFQASQSLLISLLGTGLVAIMLNPLRVRLQFVVDRLLYGQRGNPSAVLESLHQSFESLSDPQLLLEGTAATITKALMVPYASFELTVEGRQLSASSGKRIDPVIEIPLLYRSEQIGKLLVAARSPGEDLSELDEKLLRNIAAQTTTAILAVHLAQDLQKTRTNLVTTREEERRRLRRDLHDSLGPVLASQGLKVAAARELVDNNPGQARKLLEEIVAQNETTVGEIRRLVYGLRPPALDELGLQGALIDFANNMNHPENSQKPLAVKIQAPPEGLPPLPAAVEVAAYRIATEAVTNAAKHAKANTCLVTLGLNEGSENKRLSLEIKDDGVGLPQYLRTGVGLNSMRERCEEIGGTLGILSEPGKGTQLTAVLPLKVQGA